MTDPKDAGGDLYDLIEVPSVEDYEKALKASKHALKSTGGRSLILEMLRENYQAPGHTISAAELAEKMGLANYKAANLRYGNYCKELCKQMGRTPDVKAGGKRTIWLAILVKFSGGEAGTSPDQDESVEMTLRPEVVKALENSFFQHLAPGD